MQTQPPCYDRYICITLFVAFLPLFRNIPTRTAFAPKWHTLSLTHLIARMSRPRTRFHIHIHSSTNLPSKITIQVGGRQSPSYANQHSETQEKAAEDRRRCFRRDVQRWPWRCPHRPWRIYSKQSKSAVLHHHEFVSRRGVRPGWDSNTRHLRGQQMRTGLRGGCRWYRAFTL